MRKKYKLIIFDWDGTLMDSVPRIVSSMQAAAEDIGLRDASPKEIRDIIGLSLDTALMQLWPELSEVGIQEMQQAYGRHFLAQSTQPMPFFADAMPLLSWLKSHPSKPLLAVATGKKRQGLNRILSEYNLLDYFDATRCGDESHSKPNPQMLEYLLQTLDILPEQALMIGDTDYDMHMAHAANVDCVAVSYGAHAYSRLQASNPTMLCDSISQVRQWLDI